MNELMISNPGIPTEHEMSVFLAMSRSAVQSKMYKEKGDENAILMIMLAARELNLPPMQCLNGGLNIIQGKVEISARMMNALIRRAGHRITVKESTDTGCTLTGIRGDNSDTATVTFTMADAQRAGLVKAGGGWQKFPMDMCFARALSRLARQLFSDVIGIGYVEGEIREAQPVAVEVEVIEEEEDVLMSRLLNVLEGFEVECVEEYITVVGKHFGWQKRYTLQELLKDPSAMKTKFNAWYQRRQEKTAA